MIELPITWTCHICKRERPDAKISVQKNLILKDNINAIDERIRYCNDNVDCIEKSWTFSFFDKKPRLSVRPPLISGQKRDQKKSDEAD